ncbi:MAG: hypothetical protein QOI99_1557 [Actinomycetota bacterium]|jgi:hypothetical protein|nr:hypothetical protein [Actinomycetota bacterium]
MTDDHEDEARAEAEWLKMVVRVRAMLAQAQSSTYPQEVEVYTRKAMSLAKRYEIDEWLLEAPGADLDIVIVGAQLRRLNTIMAGYAKFTRIEYEDQTREWTDYIRQYDATLEVATELLNIPLPVLPTGVPRRFRPEAQLHIEKLMLEAGYDVSARPGWDPLVDSQTPNLDQVVEGEIAKIAAPSAAAAADIPTRQAQVL